MGVFIKKFLITLQTYETFLLKKNIKRFFLLIFYSLLCPYQTIKTIIMKDMMQKSFEYEKAFESDKWVKEIPYIQFKPEWKVKIIPPLCGAVVRFIVEYNDKSVSVYLDCYGNLGSVSVPYWEAYPYNEDTFRCEMSDVEALVNAISYSLNY